MTYWPELRDSLMTAARREYATGPPVPQPTAPRRRVPLIGLPRLSSVGLLLATATAIAVAVVALVVVRHAPQSPVSGGTSGARVSERAARKVANEVLRQLALPPGAVGLQLVRGTPYQVWTPADVIATPQHVDAFRVWHLRARSEDVIRFIEAHPPAGSSLTKISEGGTGSTPSKLVIFQATFFFSFPGDSSTRIFRELAVEVFPTRSGGTILRADGEAGWLYPRDQIPANVDRLEVTTARVRGQHVVKRTMSITSRRRIQNLIATVNALPGAPPTGFERPKRGGPRCFSNHFINFITFDFYAGGRAQPVASVGYVPSCGLASLMGRLVPGWPDRGLNLRVGSESRELMSFAARIH